MTTRTKRVPLSKDIRTTQSMDKKTLTEILIAISTLLKLVARDDQFPLPRHIMNHHRTPTNTATIAAISCVNELDIGPATIRTTSPLPNTILVIPTLSYRMPRQEKPHILDEEAFLEYIC